MSKASPPNPTDPINYWLQKRKRNKSQNTFLSNRTALNHFREFLSEQGLEPAEVDQYDCLEFIEYIQNKEEINSGASLNAYFSGVNEFYRYFSNRGTFETNPMAVALEESDPDTDYETHRRKIDLDEMREFFQSIKKPLNLAINTLLAKTGVRASEAANINLQDVHLDHPKVRTHLPRPRVEIEDHPDTLFVPKGRSQNKREISTMIPIDDELKQSLVYWLAARTPAPPEIERNPLFTFTSNKGHDGVVGYPLTRVGVFYAVKRCSEPFGWYEVGAGRRHNVTPAVLNRHKAVDFTVSRLA
jgi:site-specific recombinase XerD